MQLHEDDDTQVSCNIYVVCPGSTIPRLDTTCFGRLQMTAVYLCCLGEGIRKDRLPPLVGDQSPPKLSVVGTNCFFVAVVSCNVWSIQSICVQG